MQCRIGVVWLGKIDEIQKNNKGYFCNDIFSSDWHIFIGKFNATALYLQNENFTSWWALSLRALSPINSAPFSKSILPPGGESHPLCDPTFSKMAFCFVHLRKISLKSRVLLIYQIPYTPPGGKRYAMTSQLRQRKRHFLHMR